jgi:trans-aconitate methyltransferase
MRQYQLLAAVLEQEAGEEESLSILDFGCGSGSGRLYLPKRHGYIGVERNGKATSQLAKTGAYVVKTDFLEGEEYPSERDAAVCVRAERYPPQTLLWRMSRAVKDGGLVAVTVPTEEEQPFILAAKEVLTRLRRLSLPVANEQITALMGRRGPRV